jgi:hypothetical protein
MTRNHLLLAALLLAAPAARPLAAQAAPSGVDPATLRGDRWQITRKDGEILWDLRLVRLDGEQLIVSMRDSTASVQVAEIDEIRLLKKSDLTLGAGGGGGMAALMGTDDEIYDFKPLEFIDRLRTVQKLLVYHPPAGAAPAEANPRR